MLISSLVKVEYLGLLNCGIFSVAHGGYLQALHTFLYFLRFSSFRNTFLPHLVPLLPELLHQSVHPLHVQSQWLGGVGQVRAVDHILENL